MCRRPASYDAGPPRSVKFNSRWDISLYDLPEGYDLLNEAVVHRLRRLSMFTEVKAFGKKLVRKVGLTVERADPLAELIPQVYQMSRYLPTVHRHTIGR